jgi:hypothetical protein
VRSGKWKLHTNKGRPAQLYDLENDIGEKANVIKSHPEVVRRFKRHLKAFSQDLSDNSRPAAFVENPKPLSVVNSESATTTTPAPSQAKGSHTENTKSNFVVIFTDDQGYGDVGCFGSTDVRTPSWQAHRRRFSVRGIASWNPLAKHVGYADNIKPLEDCHQQSIKLRWPDLAGG